MKSTATLASPEPQGSQIASAGASAADGPLEAMARKEIKAQAEYARRSLAQSIRRGLERLAAQQRGLR